MQQFLQMKRKHSLKYKNLRRKEIIFRTFYKNQNQQNNSKKYLLFPQIIKKMRIFLTKKPNKKMMTKKDIIVIMTVDREKMKKMITKDVSQKRIRYIYFKRKKGTMLMAYIITVTIFNASEIIKLILADMLEFQIRMRNLIIIRKSITAIQLYQKKIQVYMHQRKPHLYTVGTIVLQICKQREVQLLLRISILTIVLQHNKL